MYLIKTPNTHLSNKLVFPKLYISDRSNSGKGILSP